MTTSDLHSAFTTAVTQRDLIQAQRVELLDEVLSLQNHVALVEKAQALIQDTAEETQSHVKVNLEDIVNSAIVAIFGDTSFTFHVEFEKKRGKVECDLFVAKDGNTDFRMSPMEANGGGLVDVIAFGLRVALLVLSTSERILETDEPFRFLSKDMKQQCGAWVRKLSEDLGIQIIMITHEHELIANAHRVFEVTQDDGVHSEIEIIKS